MQDNDLTTLPAGIFNELTSLTRLDLGVNDLSTLPVGIFDGLTSLTELDLGSNDLSTLPAGIFDELTSLTELDLGDNDLSLLPAGIFDELTSLTRLSLSSNDLSTLPDGLFDELAGLSLRGLFLQSNPGAPFSPVVNAGSDLAVQPEAAASISGSVTGPWGDFVRWDWIQVDGPDSDTPISRALPLTGGNTARPSFTAPSAEGELYFRSVVAPGRGGYPNESYGHAHSNPDWVTVTVSNTLQTHWRRLRRSTSICLEIIPTRSIHPRLYYWIYRKWLLSLWMYSTCSASESTGRSFRQWRPVLQSRYP